MTVKKPFTAQGQGTSDELVSETIRRAVGKGISRRIPIGAKAPTLPVGHAKEALSPVPREKGLESRKH